MIDFHLIFKPVKEIKNINIKINLNNKLSIKVMVKSIVCNLLRYWNVDNFLYIFKDANQQNADLFWKIVWNKKNIFDLFTAWQVVLSDKSRYLPNLTITTDNSEFLKRNKTLPLSLLKIVYFLLMQFLDFLAL